MWFVSFIQAAGLDVTTPEPLPTSHELFQLPNCGTHLVVCFVVVVVVAVVVVVVVVVVSFDCGCRHGDVLELSGVVVVYGVCEGG